jgi:hypothetical protein
VVALAAAPEESAGARAERQAAVPARVHAAEPVEARRQNRVRAGPVVVRRQNRVRAAPAVVRQRALANAAARREPASGRRQPSLGRPARAPLLVLVLALGKRPLQQVRRSRTGQALARAQVPVSAAARARASVREPAQVNVPEPVQAQPAADELRT